MSDDAHAVLVFYGGIVGFIIIILCICCIVYLDNIRTRDVAPVILDEEDMVYANMNNENTSLNDNIV